MTKARPKTPSNPGEVRTATRILPEQWTLCFKHVATSGSLSRAIRDVFGPERNANSIGNAIRNDVLLQKRLSNAKADFQASILAELKRRAMEGVDEPVFHKGDIVGFKKVFSDQALLALARHFIPSWLDKRSASDIRVHNGDEESDIVFSLSYSLAERMPAALRAALIPVLQWCREQRLQIVEPAEPLLIEHADEAMPEDDPYSLTAAQMNGDWA